VGTTLESATHGVGRGVISPLDALLDAGAPVPVFADRYARGYPAHPEAPPALYAPLGRALASRYDTDAHFSAYSCPGVPRRLAGRGALAAGEVSMVALVADVDHAWCLEEAAKVDALFAARGRGLAYTTRGGYRIVYRLAESIRLATPADAERWKIAYDAWRAGLAAYGIDADPACKDWTRLYRLPLVVRDGVPSAPVFVGDPRLIAAWPEAITLPEIPASVLTERVGLAGEPESASLAMLDFVRADLRALGNSTEAKTTNPLVYRAGGVCGDWGLNRSDTRRVLEEWDAKNYTPRDPAELELVLDNAEAYRGSEFGAARVDWEVADGMLRVIGFGGLRVAERVERKDHADVEPEVVTTRAAANPPSAPRVEYGLDLTDYLGVEDPGDDPDAWIIESIVASSVPQVFAGPMKSHKTFLLEHMSIAIATGTKWLGKFPTRQARVLLMPMEDPLKITRMRVWRLARGMGINPKDIDPGWLRVEPQEVPFRFNLQADVDRMLRTIEKHRTDFILVDSLTRTHTGDENSVKEMHVVTHTWAEICRQTGVAFGLIHHFNKAGEGSLLKRLRGTTDIAATARHLVGITKQETGLSLVEFDGNLHPLADPFLVRVSDSPEGEIPKWVRIEHAGDPEDRAEENLSDEIMATVRAHSPKPVTKTEIRSTIHRNREKVYGRIAQLERMGWLVNQGRDGWALGPRAPKESAAKGGE
jgi:AAA domain-containing protein